MTLLHSHFRPEFLNRVDDIIVFGPLGKEQLVKIIELRLEDVRRLLADRKISLELTDAAKDALFTQGYDANFGARPDRKSTRLNSSHLVISYAVFCLTKKIYTY